MDPVAPPRSDEPVTEQELLALVDGPLSEPQRLAMEARLAHDPAAAATRRAWQQQRDALKALHRAVLDEPVPAPLAAAARQAGQARQQMDQWWRWGGMAAGILCAFGLGWMSHGQYGQRAGAQFAAPSTATATRAAVGAREFARQASVAHLLYAPEVRHPVEVAAAQQEHLVQWLSKRLERPLKVPDLTTRGYELMGGRLLPGNEGARAQFMFQNKAGERVTLYLGTINGPAANPSAPPATAPDRRETAFSFSTEGPVPGFYWVDQGFGYALAGNVPREQLMALAELVYRQL